MEISFKKIAIKDINNLPNQDKEEITEILFNDLPEINSIHEINNLVNIKGYKHYYRIRTGNYRIGLKYENNRIVIMRVLHRKEIYRFFP